MKTIIFSILAMLSFSFANAQEAEKPAAPVTGVAVGTDFSTPETDTSQKAKKGKKRTRKTSEPKPAKSAQKAVTAPEQKTGTAAVEGESDKKPEETENPAGSAPAGN